MQPPRSAYIHVPFCRHRCGYCNFTLVAGRDDLIEPYLTALGKELSWLGEAREVDTLFLGGGTPTHLRGEQLIRLLTTVLRWHPLSGNSNIEFRNPKQIRSTKSEACLRPAGPHPDPLSATVDLRPEGWGDEITEFSVEA